ncbi:hypothetical protein E2C01_004853 [Portunus trituberculatus]|uniref:Uncharacterized protein n=1 Tax=Portunus trituberculatus TaxID=210409 RepID=A0A5B7CSG3_PORTR|nr:hypothetical protein [Portunus trituberculatus]
MKATGGEGAGKEEGREEEREEGQVGSECRQVASGTPLLLPSLPDAGRSPQTPHTIVHCPDQLISREANQNVRRRFPFIPNLTVDLTSRF